MHNLLYLTLKLLLLPFVLGMDKLGRSYAQIHLNEVG